MAKINSQQENLKRRLGTDAKNPINGNFEISEGIDTLIQDIQQLLLTVPGERPFRPEYGCALKTYIWENIEVVQELGTTAIRTAIENFEPRITVLDIKNEANVNTGLIIFNIIFAINNTDEKLNLVFPFRSGTELSLP